MRPFTDVLSDIRKGRVVLAATDMLAEVVRAVDVTNKPGKLTLEITIEPEKGGGCQKILSAKLTAKKPVEDLPKGLFFSDGSGDLLRSDPSQREMFGAVDEVIDEDGVITERH